MRKFISVFAIFSLVLISPLFFSCGEGGLEPGDLLTSGNSDVDARFQDCKDGKAKPISLPSVIDPEHFSFLWLTDMHIRSDREDNFDQLGNYSNELGASFILTSGDLTDDGSGDNLDYLLSQEETYLNVPLYSALGNHDLYSNGWERFRDNIGPSVTSFVYGNSFFMFIDSASCKIGNDQMDWIEDQLRNDNSTHKFVLSHICLYDGDLETPTILCDPDERLRLLALIDKYNVDYFLCGHKHWVEEDEVDGVHHIMGGTGSPWKRPYNSKPLFWYFQVNGGDVEYSKIHFED